MSVSLSARSPGRRVLLRGRNPIYPGMLVLFLEVPRNISFVVPAIPPPWPGLFMQGVHARGHARGRIKGVKRGCLGVYMVYILKYMYVMTYVIYVGDV